MRDAADYVEGEDGGQCRQEDHDLIKANRETFTRRTRPFPWFIQDGYLYRNCSRCSSTLGFQITSDFRLTKETK